MRLTTCARWCAHGARAALVGHIRAAHSSAAFTLGSNVADFSVEQLAFRASVRAFVDREIEPHVERWEAEKEFPRDLYK